MRAGTEPQPTALGAKPRRVTAVNEYSFGTFWIGVASLNKDLTIRLLAQSSAVVRAPLRVYLMRTGGDHPEPGF